MSVKKLKEFEIYHAKNPHIYEAFERIALEMANRKERFSCRAIFHILRWETIISGTGHFKIQDHVSPYYGRLFEKRHPRHTGFFKKIKIIPSDYTIDDYYATK
jgi:hypothetical protein